MKLMKGLDALASSLEGAAVTVGTFDGVHAGHRSLLRRAIAKGAEHGLTSVAITWDRHPLTTLRPAHAPRLLCSLERRLELFEEVGLDAVAVLAFDEALSHWPPERFAEEVLSRGLDARSVVVGEGWRFGHKAAGDVPLLTKLGENLGFRVEALPLERSGDGAVSSSRVRKAVAEGDMELAKALLERPFDTDGVVIDGDHRGASLGFPTANLEVLPGYAHAPRGVYAGRARAGGEWYVAAINVGVNPTFGGDVATSEIRIEAYLLDFSGDLYGQTLRVEFWKCLRDEQKFDSADALIEQMGRDVDETRALVRVAG